ncbi:CPBP family intramembrane metalloprotease [Blastopirellula sp. JC732]|uniref:CPBP family intramembrane metalloprotease n=1 Tax=Blastopirellula sediminis TaxID=2894196 RepID=A0A9X1SEM3_9BACT|nr:CPBP family intramembrane glutamic endopeptidase [Blastopirellula sediminis]MCC9607834.1 CPBP family intramembrane metalloprotease [Blastopirellula sediminis]MCC9627373.1 CPBP family intramembrane metalloprotease [Blastopirellula sediminis]
MGQIIFGLGALALMLVLLTVCVTGWTWAFFRLSSGQPILKQESGETISWGLVDLFATVVIVGILLMTFQGFALAATGAKFPIDTDLLTANQQAAMIMAFAGAELLTVLAVSGLIFLRGYGLQFFGERGERFIGDLALGFGAFGMLVVPTLILQAILAYLRPYEHPLIDMLIKDKSVPMAFASVTAAVIAAPLFEEFAFRGLFQGWLQDVVDGRLKIANVFLGRFRFLNAATDSAEEFAAPLQETDEAIVAAVPVSSMGNPYSSPPSFEMTSEVATTEENIERTMLQMFGPILMSASLFALMHLGQGLAPIPLFFLALGLGYLYQRTRRLTPCVVVHFLLNGQSMALLLIQVFVIGDDAGVLVAK